MISCDNVRKWFDVSSRNRTDHTDLTDILLKVALSNHNIICCACWLLSFIAFLTDFRFAFFNLLFQQYKRIMGICSIKVKRGVGHLRLFTTFSAIDVLFWNIKDLFWLVYIVSLNLFDVYYPVDHVWWEGVLIMIYV
jgi:hypothetical protein